MSKKIVIDSGHGGEDNGASGNGIIEKDLTLIKGIIDSCMRELRKCNTFYCGANGIGLYAKPDNQEPVGFVKIKQYAGLIYCGEEFSL